MRADTRAVWKPWRVFACVIAACLVPGPTHAAEPLRSIAEILALTDDAPAVEHRAIVRGVVTLVSPHVVIQDGRSAIYVEPMSPPGGEPRPIWKRPLGVPLEVGEEIELAGALDFRGFTPRLVMHSIRRLGTQPLPEPAAIDFTRLFAGGDDGRRVRVKGVVQAVLDNPEGWSLIFESASRRFRVIVAHEVVPERPDHWIDADVEVVGVCYSYRNSRGEFLAPGMFVGRPEDLRVLQPPESGPFDLPTTPLGRIARFRLEPLGGHRLRTTGIVSFATPQMLYLQEGVGGVRVELAPSAAHGQELQAGDRVEVAGFPDVRSGIGAISWAMARKIAAGPPPDPERIQPSEILRLNAASSQMSEVARPGSYDGCLIRCRGRVEAINRSSTGTVITVIEEGTAFTATLLDAIGLDATPIIPGSEVEVTGIVKALRWSPAEDDLLRGSSWLSQIELLLRSAADIRVVRLPPWWTPARLTAAAVAAGLIALAATAWVTTLHHEVARQTELLAHEMRSRRDAAIEFDATLRERSRLAANLHDTLLQALAGSVLQIDLCRRSLAGRRVEAVADQLDVAKRMVKHAADDLRNSVWALRTSPLAGQSLPESLRSLVSQLGVDKPGMIAIRFEGESFPLPRFVAGNLLLVAQEAIRNALHHAKATSIDVSVRFDASAHRVGLTVADDGSGFAWGTQLGPERGHFGLQGMRERVEAIRGHFVVETSPNRGTRVTAEVAVQPVDEAFRQEDGLPDADPPTPGRGNGHPSVPAQKPVAAAG